MAWYSFLTEPSNFFGGLFSTISAPIRRYQQRKRAIVDAKHEMEMADLSFRTQLILNRESHNQAWEIEALKQSGQPRSPMQWITFLVLGAPFIIAWFNPAIVAAYFTVSLKVIPLWYQQVFVSIIGVIWGIANLKNAATGINKALLMRKSVDVSRMKEIDADRIIRPKTYNKMFEAKVQEIKEEILSDEELHDLYPDLKDDK